MCIAPCWLSFFLCALITLFSLSVSPRPSVFSRAHGNKSTGLSHRPFIAFLLVLGGQIGENPSGNHQTFSEILVYKWNEITWYNVIMNASKWVRSSQASKHVQQSDAYTGIYVAWGMQPASQNLRDNCIQQALLILSLFYSQHISFLILQAHTPCTYTVK